MKHNLIFILGHVNLSGIMKKVMVTVLVALFATSTFAQSEPKYKAVVPDSVTTPATVETRIGTLKFNDGLPDKETVTRVFDNLDFARGMEAFMTGMPAASVQALNRALPRRAFRRTRPLGLPKPSRMLARFFSLRIPRLFTCGRVPMSQTGRWWSRCRPMCWG